MYLKLLLYSALSFCFCISTKQTNAQPTLKAQVRYLQDTFNTIRTDSIVYTFSNGRSYHSEDVFNTNTTSGNYYLYLLKETDFVNQFDTLTSYHWHALYPHSLSKQTVVNLYNSSNQVIKSLTYIAPTSFEITDYTYNTAGQLTSIHRSNNIDSFVYSGGNLVNYSKYWLTPSTYKSWNITYNYNSNNEITSINDTGWYLSSGPTHIRNTLYTYNTSHKAISVIYQNWDFATSAYIDSLRKIFSYNTSGNPVSCELASWNGTTWVNQYKAVQGYMNPDVFRTHLMDWSGSAWIPAVLDTIIYLYYNLPANIETRAIAKNVECNIYPVPASSYIDINLSQKDNQPLSFAIFSLEGRLISKWNEDAVTKYTKRIALDELPAGQYVLYVNNKKEELYRQFIVSH